MDQNRLAGLSLLRRLQRAADPVLRALRAHGARGEFRLGLADRPRLQLHRQLFLPPARQPVFLADVPVPGVLGALSDGADLYAQVRHGRRHRLRVPQALCQKQGLRRHRRAAVRLLRLPDLQHFLQSVPRGRRLLPAAAHRHGGIRCRTTAAGSLRSPSRSTV